MRALLVLALLGLCHCGQTTPPKCSSANCPGCCTGAGECQSGGIFADCGKGGEICATCDTGQACVAGTCGAAPADAGCDQSTCGGCCDAAHVCRSGLSDSACGYRAFACVDCADAGLSCDMHSCL